MDAHAYGFYRTAMDFYQIFDFIVELYAEEITDQAWPFPLNGKGLWGVIAIEHEKNSLFTILPFLRLYFPEFRIRGDRRAQGS